MPELRRIHHLPLWTKQTKLTELNNPCERKLYWGIFWKFNSGSTSNSIHSPADSFNRPTWSRNATSATWSARQRKAPAFPKYLSTGLASQTVFGDGSSESKNSSFPFLGGNESPMPFEFHYWPPGVASPLQSSQSESGSHGILAWTWRSPGMQEALKNFPSSIGSPHIGPLIKPEVLRTLSGMFQPAIVRMEPWQDFFPFKSVKFRTVESALIAARANL